MTADQRPQRDEVVERLDNAVLQALGNDENLLLRVHSAFADQADVDDLRAVLDRLAQAEREMDTLRIHYEELQGLFAQAERRAEEAERLVGWQPISTAPRDGTVLILGNADAVFTDCYAFSTTDDDEWENWLGSDEPTHWQYPPEPPLAPAADAGEEGRSDAR